MKEDIELMDNKITDIGTCTVECLKGREFNKVILGFIVKKEDESITKNIELFYESTDNKFCYFNDLVCNNEFDNTAEKEKYLELQKLLNDLYEYCVECGDEWKYMTLTIQASGSFGIDFKYDTIEISEWRKKYDITVS